VYNASYHNARKVIKYAGFLAGTERVFRPGSMRNLTYRMDILTREHVAAVFLEPDPVVGADGDVAPGRYFRRRAGQWRGPLHAKHELSYAEVISRR
jgi:hypothetical protein